MKKLQLILSLLLTLSYSFVFSQTSKVTKGSSSSSSSSSVLTIINDSILLTGQHRLNLDSDRIEKVTVLKGELSSDYGENLEAVVIIYLENTPNFESLSTEQLNDLMKLPRHLPIYFNGHLLKKKLQVSYNPKTIITPLKINRETYTNIGL